MGKPLKVNRISDQEVDRLIEFTVERVKASEGDGPNLITDIGLRNGAMAIELKAWRAKYPTEQIEVCLPPE